MMQMWCPQSIPCRVVTQESNRLDAAPRPPIALTNAVSWRSEGIKHRKNEIFLDVIEKVNLLVASNGTVLHSEIMGSIQMKSFLSGMPELKLGLNDKLMFEATGRSTNRIKAVELEDIKFHQCVRLGEGGDTHVLALSWWLKYVSTFISSHHMMSSSLPWWHCFTDKLIITNQHHHLSSSINEYHHLISSLCVSSLREWSHDILHTSWRRVRAHVLSIEHPGDCWWWRIIVHPYIDPYIIIIIISIDQPLMYSLLHRHTRIINLLTSPILLVHAYPWLLHNQHLWRPYCTIL